MNEIMLETEIILPYGSIVLSDEGFYTTTYKLNDTYTEQMDVDVRGMSVKIIRYNRENDDVMVWINGRGRQMKREDVGEYIRKNT